MARSYRSIADWEGIYEQIIAEDGGVVPSTLLERRLAKSRQAAWKLLERHRKAGILRRYASPGIHILLTSEPNVNNVRIVENNSNSGASQTTLLISKPHAEHENKPNLSKSAILENTRSQIQTQKTQDSIKAIQWCLRRGGHSYRYSDDLVGHLVSAKDVLRLDALSLPRNSWALPFTSPRLHRLCFETFDERAPFARPFDA